jgi:predicted ATPase
LLSIPTRDRYPLLNLPPQKRKEKTLQLQLTQLEGPAEQQPVLMVWEDVHWSDPTTRDSLDLPIDWVPTRRVLVIITFRPELSLPWVGRPHVSLLSLSWLPPKQRVDIISHVTGGKALPKEIIDQIVDRTDGAPLFVEELTKSVVEAGIVTETDDVYTVSGPVTTVAIPSTLHASLLARLDRLALHARWRRSERRSVGRSRTTSSARSTTVLGSAIPCRRAARFGVSPTMPRS